MQRWYQKLEYLLTAHKLGHCPEDSGVEIVFAGRSNAGKSSAINAIAGRRGLARTSKTPGRTRQLIYFECGPQARVVDLPGYGYAKVAADVQLQWHKVLDRYFRERQSLAGLVLVVDIRRRLTELDRQMLDWCRASSVPVHILLTKADKLSKGAASQGLQQVRAEMEADELTVTAQLFSATRGTGVEEAREFLGKWLNSGQKKAPG